MVKAPHQKSVEEVVEDYKKILTILNEKAYEKLGLTNEIKRLETELEEERKLANKWRKLQSRKSARDQVVPSTTPGRSKPADPVQSGDW